MSCRFAWLVGLLALAVLGCEPERAAVVEADLAPRVEPERPEPAQGLTQGPAGRAYALRRSMGLPQDQEEPRTPPPVVPPVLVEPSEEPGTLPRDESR
jgi:hypothetical protein